MVDRMTWSIEDIPDADGLYVRFLSQHSSVDGLTPNFFRPHNGGLSADWSYYGSPTATRSAPTLKKRDPSEYGVAELHVGGVRSVEGLLVVHSPKHDNRAHADVLGLARDQVEDVLVTVRRELLVATVRAIHFLPGDPNPSTESPH
jgi:hypothetical protein